MFFKNKLFLKNSRKYKYLFISDTIFITTNPERVIELYNNNYIENGVILFPNVIAKGDNAKVVYRGLLSNCGADAVYMHLGYGDKWENRWDIKMKKTDEGFVAQFPVTSNKTLHIAFKDSANNWDNNSGKNYSFEVQDRKSQMPLC